MVHHKNNDLIASKSLEIPQMNLLYGRIRNLVGGFKALHDVCKKQAPGHCSVLQTLLSYPGPQEGLKIKGNNIGPFCFYSCQNLDEQLTPIPLLNSEFQRPCCLDLSSLALAMVTKASLLSNLHFKRLGSNAASSRGDYLLLILRESFILPCLAWELEKLGIVPCSTYPKPLVQNKD